MRMSKAIGIDLGTTNSCVAVIEGGTPVVIPLSKGKRTMPSVVAFSKNGERLVGEAAQHQATTNPDRTISSIKRHMGTEWVKKIGEKEYKPQVISAMILMQLKKDAEAYLGEEITDAVITVPAYFNDVQRQATKDAGRIAGLNVLRIINEPTSAALSYGLNHGEAQKIMVYDLGGGTFDVSIIEMGDGVVEVLATAGDNYLGGDDFDKRIIDWIVEDIRKQYHVNVVNNFVVMQRIKDVAEQAKKELSTSASTNILLPYLVENRDGMVHYEAMLTREAFQDMVKDLVERTAIPVKKALEDAGISPSELGKVLLVGGSTRMPIVQEKVRALTGKEPSRNINPDECVAMGAAIMGSTLQGTGLVAAGTGQELLLLDVTPLSLSIETLGGVATRLIDRNATLPVRYSRVFSTAMPYQKVVEIHVLQGERPMARDNKTIGKFKLKGIKGAPAGVPQIEVTFDIDTNGILMVSAKDLDTGKEQSITITADDRMSDLEIEQAIRDAQAYAGLDTLRQEAIQVMGEANSLLNKVEQKMKEEKKNISKQEKKEIKKTCSNLQTHLRTISLDKITAEQLNKLKSLVEQLEIISTTVLHI